MTKKKKPKKHWLLQVQQVDEDLFVVLPPNLLKQFGWQEGDNLLWTEKDDGYILNKVEHKGGKDTTV